MSPSSLYTHGGAYVDRFAAMSMIAYVDRFAPMSMIINT